MSTPKHVTVRGGSTPPLIVDLSPAEQPDYDARLATAADADTAAQAQRANGATLRQKARQALQDNAAFLALPPVQQQAQAVAQVVRLTQEMSAIIRLVVGQLDSTAGT